ncbi:MAG: hypothetical protein ACJAVR_001755 [Paracoccaceae bacterium]|jgi:hypothetical protein
MSFQPSVPLTGVGGWKLLQRTEATQRAAFSNTPTVKRDVEHFRAKIADTTTAAELVADPQLLRVALGAFGLEDEAGKFALIRRALEDGVTDKSSLANRMVDPKWKRFVSAFGFGDGSGGQVARTGFAEEIASAYEARQFETALGESDDSLRLALNFRREIQRFADGASPDGYTWFEALGDRPVRAVLEGAFGLPSSFGKLDIDQQRDAMKDKTTALLGSSSLAVFKEEGAVDKLLTRYLARVSAESGPSATTPGATALTLLTSSGFGAGATFGLLLSNGG